MNASPADSDAPNCWQCQHFSVSWDPNLPYACRLMGFKSRIMPALEVLRADGTRCHGFLRKPAAGVAGVNEPGVADAAAASQTVVGQSIGADAASSTTAKKSTKVSGLYSTFNKLA